MSPTSGQFTTIHTLELVTKTCFVGQTIKEAVKKESDYSFLYNINQLRSDNVLNNPHKSHLTQ